MEPKEFDFEFPRGDTCIFEFELTDSNGAELGANQNFDLTMTVRDSAKEIVFQKKYSKGTITVSGKTVKIVIEHSDTDKLMIGGKYKYDVQFQSGDYYKTIYRGMIVLTEEQTY